MRFVMTVLLWLCATVTFAVALPAAWIQRHLVDADGYATFAQRSAADPALQQAVASELANRIGNLGFGVSTVAVGAAASAYTSSPSFPGQFAQVNRFAHRWLFSTAVASEVDSQGRWLIDLGPLVADSSFKEALQRFGIQPPERLPVPLTDTAPEVLRPGVLRSLATWGPWLSVGSAVLTGVFALSTLVVASRRGRAMTALGASALVVAAAGWAGLEIARGRITRALDNTSGEIRRIADSIVGQAISSMHEWLNLALLAGGALMALGIVAAALGSLIGSSGRSG
jgi:hypothetical protein